MGPFIELEWKGREVMWPSSFMVAIGFSEKNPSQSVKMGEFPS